MKGDRTNHSVTKHSAKHSAKHSVKHSVMCCRGVARNASAYVERELPLIVRQSMDSHLDGCEDCSGHTAQLLELHAALHSLPRRVPPAELTTRLRVLASRELARRNTSATLTQIAANWKSEFDLWLHNLMRPIAIPTAGGVFSAVVLFGVMAQSFAGPGLSSEKDIPTGLYRGATIKTMAPVGINGGDLAVEVTIDDQGRVVDYRIPNCQNVAGSTAVRRNIENNLLFTTFTPATTFGQPMAGKIRIAFRSSRIDVKG